MPRRLPERCGPDCILGFRAAAEQQYADGLRLAEGERRTAAVYLWGYAVEMLLKAAYFRVFGYDPRRSITTADLRAAVQLAGLVGYTWPTVANLHHLPAWAQLLVSTRATLGIPHTPVFAADIVRQSVRVYRLWRETLRYHDNVAYEFEVRTVRECAEWFREHGERL